MSRRRFALGCALLCALQASTALAAPDVPALEELGKRVFFDSISEPERMACATCHVPTMGWTADVAAINLFQVAVTGADPHTVAGRKPPSAAYASYSPPFGDAIAPGGCAAQTFGVFCRGGVFWDGRATGETISADDVFQGDTDLAAAYGDFLGPVADQALGPFANDVEQNVPLGDDGGLPGAKSVCQRVQAAMYAPLFARAWGEDIDCSPSAVARSFKRIAVAISAWEHSPEMNQFSSKRDLALAADADHAFPLDGLSDEENRGHDLFYGITSPLNPSGKNARCSACHRSGGAEGNDPEELYTDHRYHHLGLPPNYDIANFDPGAPDPGLSRHTNPSAPLDSGHAGSFKTPTLRNVDKRVGMGVPKAYMHNGYFKTLADVVHFYNTATAKLDPVNCPAGTTAAEARARDCWPAAEIDNGLQSSNFGLLGNLMLDASEEAALVAYLKTLTDTDTVQAPLPYVPGPNPPGPPNPPNPPNSPNPRGGGHP